MKEEWKVVARFGVGAFLLYLCIHYWGTFTKLLMMGLNAAFPLVIGCVIAYVVNILMSLYEAHYFPKRTEKLIRKSARPVCMLAAFLSVILVVVLVMYIVIPELISCVKVLVFGIPKQMEKLAVFVDKTDLFSEQVVDSLRKVDWNTTVKQVASFLTRGIGDTVSFAAGAVKSAFSGLVNLMIGLVFAIYLLASKERLSSQCNRLLKRYLKPVWEKKTRYFLTVLNRCFHSYIVGQCMEAVILGVLCTLGMALFRFPYAVMTGTVIGVTALIPVAGAYIGGAVGFLLILTVSPTKAVLFLVYLVVLQQLEGNLIYPRVVGSSIGLPGIWVLAAVTIGGGVFGISGMLLGVPLAAALYQMLKADMDRPEILSGNEKKILQK